MNYWNGTCDITHLPILKDEQVVLIPLYRVSDYKVRGCNSPTDNFAPLAFPMLGQYDGSGGIYNVLTNDQNKELLLYREFYTVEQHNSTRYRRCDDYDSFDDFVQNVLCSQKPVFVKLEHRFVASRYVEVSFMIVHRGAFATLVREIGNRIPSGQEKHYSALLNEYFLRQMDGYRQNYNHCFTNSEKAVSASDLKNIYLRICWDVFMFATPYEAEYWEYCAKMCMRDPADEITIVASAVELHIFTVALSYMRNGYLCNAGSGSRLEETRLHFILAEFIMEHIQNCYCQTLNSSVYDAKAIERGREEPIRWSK